HIPDEGKLAFNASALSKMYDFSENQVLVILKFKVKAVGSCDFSISFNQLYGPNNQILAKDGEFYDYSAEVTETVSTEAEAMYLEIIHHGETYKAKVGDVITYTLYLEAPERITDLFASVDFNHKYIWPEEADLEKRYPNVGVSSDDFVGGGIQFAGNVYGEGFAGGKPEVLAIIDFKVTREGKIEITEGYELFTESGECYMGGFDNPGVKFSSEICIKGEEKDYVLLGDANGNGEVNIKDATTIQKASAKILTLNDEEKLRSDVNADGKVNVKDATAVQKYIAKIETGFAIGEPMN
ncbi:MAG: dockerin type I repeat-containing protein, partial [Clostridia bacterium]|nr:dockerin type I repeat-containing protein [Clostridia bacterium]